MTLLVLIVRKFVSWHAESQLFSQGNPVTTILPKLPYFDLSILSRGLNANSPSSLVTLYIGYLSKPHVKKKKKKFIKISRKKGFTVCAYSGFVRILIYFSMCMKSECYQILKDFFFRKCIKRCWKSKNNVLTDRWEDNCFIAPDRFLKLFTDIYF